MAFNINTSPVVLSDPLREALDGFYPSMKKPLHEKQ